MFGFKNAGATYQWSMTVVFHDILHDYLEVYVAYSVVKSEEVYSHVNDLKRVFIRCRQYKLWMNPLIYGFGVHFEKFLGFIIQRKRIDLDPAN